MSSPPDYLSALSALTAAGVEYVVVGVGGINFYARTPAAAHQTDDLDVLLAPNASNLASALRAFAGLGFAFEASGDPFVDVGDETILERVVAHGATLSARHEELGQIDLMTSIAGTSYTDLASDAATFQIDEHTVRVARLEKLLLAKRASGRPKDVEFLRAYDARANEDD